jgi:hypothetical protein
MESIKRYINFLEVLEGTDLQEYKLGLRDFEDTLDRFSQAGSGANLEGEELYEWSMYSDEDLRTEIVSNSSFYVISAVTNSYSNLVLSLLNSMLDKFSLSQTQEIFKSISSLLNDIEFSIEGSEEDEIAPENINVEEYLTHLRQIVLNLPHDPSSNESFHSFLDIIQGIHFSSSIYNQTPYSKIRDVFVNGIKQHFQDTIYINGREEDSSYIARFTLVDNILTAIKEDLGVNSVKKFKKIIEEYPNDDIPDPVSLASEIIYLYDHLRKS